MCFCLYLFLFLFYFLLSFFFFFFFLPPILVLSLLKLSLSLDFAQTQTQMPQAPLLKQWVSLFGSIWCFSLSLAQIDAPSVGLSLKLVGLWLPISDSLFLSDSPFCLGLLGPIGGCEAAVYWVRWWVEGWVCCCSGFVLVFLLVWLKQCFFFVLVWLWVC